MQKRAVLGEGGSNRSRRAALKILGGGLAGGIASYNKLLADITAESGSSVNPSAPRPTPFFLHKNISSSALETALSRAGAVGDGKAIDTSAIQEAVAEVEHNTRFELYGSNSPRLGIGELIWPQGLFLVDDAIIITRSLRVRGVGQAEFSSGARIQQQRPGTDLFRVEPIAQGCSVGFHNLVLRANGGGATKGALLRVNKSAGQCNSLRISQSVFATPQDCAINIECADDVQINYCLFDVSATRCINLGRGPRDRVTNVRVSENDFFAIANECISIASGDGVVVHSNNVVGQAKTKTFARIGGDNSPVGNVVIRGNTLRNVECMVDAVAFDGMIIEGNAIDAVGGGGRALIRCSGTCTGLVVTGNRLKGVSDPAIYDDRAATVTGAVISDNAITAVGGTGPALLADNTSGRIGINSIVGFVRNGIGHKWGTIGREVRPGTIQPRRSFVKALNVVGGRSTDFVLAKPRDLFLQHGLVIGARVERDRVSIDYENISDRAITVPDHDVDILITR